MRFVLDYLSINHNDTKNFQNQIRRIIIIIICVWKNKQADCNEIDTNIMVQLFSPIVASQRIMFCQFDNSYTSIQLDDDLNFVFEEVSTKINRDGKRAN